ncbi:MAG: hypothetical protein L6408_05700, partial [Nanoarchaeota archaeon]|nr:hypothetical protein [Nanoarchaeota archaeon]
SKKEKEIIQRIEANTPSDFKERAEYLYDQAECLEFLKKSNLKTNGHFVTCPKHTNKKSLDNTLKRIIDVSLGEDNKFFFYPYLGNDIISTPCMLDDFLNMHYTKEEVKTRIISTTGIESNIEKHAYLAELD